MLLDSLNKGVAQVDLSSGAEQLGASHSGAMERVAV